MSITKKSLGNAAPAAKSTTKPIKAAPVSSKAVTAMKVTAARPCLN